MATQKVAIFFSKFSFCLIRIVFALLSDYNIFVSLYFLFHNLQIINL